MRHLRAVGERRAKRLPHHAVELAAVHNVPAADHLLNEKRHPGTQKPTVTLAREATEATTTEVVDRRLLAIAIIVGRLLPAQLTSARRVRSRLGQRLI